MLTFKAIGLFDFRSLSRTFHRLRLYVFPRFSLDTRFRAFTKGWTFSRASRWLYVFAPLPQDTGWTFSRASRWLPVFPLLLPVAR